MDEQQHPTTPEQPLPTAVELSTTPPDAAYEEPSPRGRRRGSRTPRRRTVGWSLAAAAVVVAGGLFLLSAGADNGGKKGAGTTDDSSQTAEKDGAEAKAPVPVEVAEVATGTVSSYITATANLVAENEVKLLSEVEGRVVEVTAEEGQRVEKGRVLAVLDRGDAEIALEKARVREENASTVFERGRELSKDELISREELDRRRTEYRLARQERAEAEWRLEKTNLRAPISGRVSLRAVQVGQHLRPGDEVFQITDFDPLIARIYLPERDVLDLGPGRSVSISLAADPGAAFRGRVRQVSPVVDTATGTVKVTVEAISPPREVRPGSFVTLQLVRERRTGAVVVPKGAVIKELQQAHVFVAAGGDAHKRPVTLGLEEGDRVQVLAGVEPGEQVVVAGQGGLKDGAPIRILETPETLPEAR